MINIIPGKNNDPIKPNHYRQGEQDLITTWSKIYPPNEFKTAMKTHIHKYVHRYNYKGGIEDLDKASYYIERLKEFEMEYEDEAVMANNILDDLKDKGHLTENQYEIFKCIVCEWNIGEEKD